MEKSDPLILCHRYKVVAGTHLVGCEILVSPLNSSTVIYGNLAPPFGGQSISDTNLVTRSRNLAPRYTDPRKLVSFHQHFFVDITDQPIGWLNFRRINE